MRIYIEEMANGWMVEIQEKPEEPPHKVVVEYEDIQLPGTVISGLARLLRAVSVNIERRDADRFGA